MDKDRLLKLAEFLESPALAIPGKFNLTIWMSAYRAAQGNFHSPVAPEHQAALRKKAETTTGPAFDSDDQPIECKTVGCAVGWACTIPEFKAAGLSLKRFSEVNAYPVYQISPWRLVGGVDAVTAFFDINRQDYGTLFEASHYPIEDRHNPKAVAARIREACGGTGV